eukprot:3246138-Pleurochrysis_carterae.AAC.1
MRRHADGQVVEHASWALNLPAKERRRKKAAERASRAAAAPTAARSSDAGGQAQRDAECPVSTPER